VPEGPALFFDISEKHMNKLQAKRTGRAVHLPKYQNAEMLMLEFFAGERVTISPTGPGFNRTHTVVVIDEPLGRLDELLIYINENI
jgi:hypothetical protein